MESRIEFNGRTINVKEPTISDWSKVMKYKDLLDEEELYYKMLEEFTGMEKDEILKQDAATIIRLGDVVQNILMYENKKLYKEIEHNGMTYELMDVNNISFGQYVDLDTFLRKDEKYRTQHLNELAAYMYVEKGTKYADSDFKKRIEAMKDLPIKYINSALFFLLNIAEASQSLTQLYSKNKLMVKLLKIRIVFMVITDGIMQFHNSPKTKYGKLIMWLISPLSVPLITLATLWILIKRRREKSKSNNSK
jgi:hypothetical protein